MAYKPRSMEDVLADVGKPVTVGRTSPEEVEAARVKAQGRPASDHGHNPAFKAWVAEHIVDVIGRTLSGPPQVGGNMTNYTLSSEQFAQWRKTGAWGGRPPMPTQEEMDTPDPKPPDKEWTPL